MCKLRIFKMCINEWDNGLKKMNKAFFAGDHCELTGSITRNQQFEDRGFQYFNCPSLEITGQDIFRYGTGISKDGEGFEYLYYGEEYDNYDSVREE